MLKRESFLSKARNFITLTLLVFIIITLAYSIAGRNTVKVNILSKTSKDNTYQVYYTNGINSLFNEQMIINVPISGNQEFKNAEFKIPTREIDRLRIDFGVNPGEIEIKNISIKNGIKIVELSPEKIIKVFANVGEHIEKIEARGDVLYIKSLKEDPLMYADNTSKILEETKINLSLLGVLLVIALALSALLFKIHSFIHYKGLHHRKVAFISIFMVGIFLPNIFNGLGIKVGENTEQRQLAKKPVFNMAISTINSYPKSYENYFNDNFGLKNLLVRWNSYLNVKLLKQSPLETVTVGKDGWLFYSKERDENLIDVYRGVTLFNEEELEKIKKNLEGRRDWLKSQGIPYVLMVTPNKETIYGEYLPDNIKKISEETRLDQLLSYLEKNSDLKVIDIRKEMSSKKAEERLYDKTDSHWNDYGAYIGYRAIMDDVSKAIPKVQSKELNEFQIEKKTLNEGGDLAKMLSIPKSFSEEHIILNPKSPRTALPVEKYPYKLKQGTVMETKDKNAPRLLMFMDSFTVRLIPFMSEHFSTSVYQWSHDMDKNLVNQAKPDIVVHEIAERFIVDLAK